jgi:hypothetical protein
LITLFWSVLKKLHKNIDNITPKMLNRLTFLEESKY